MPVKDNPHWQHLTSRVIHCETLVHIIYENVMVVVAVADNLFWNLEHSILTCYIKSVAHARLHRNCCNCWHFYATFVVTRARYMACVEELCHVITNVAYHCLRSTSATFTFVRCRRTWELLSYPIWIWCLLQTERQAMVLHNGSQEAMGVLQWDSEMHL